MDAATILGPSETRLSHRPLSRTPLDAGLAEIVLEGVSCTPGPRRWNAGSSSASRVGIGWRALLGGPDAARALVHGETRCRTRALYDGLRRAHR